MILSSEQLFFLPRLNSDLSREWGGEDEHVSPQQVEYANYCLNAARGVRDMLVKSAEAGEVASTRELLKFVYRHRRQMELMRAANAPDDAPFRPKYGMPMPYTGTRLQDTVTDAEDAVRYAAYARDVAADIEHYYRTGYYSM